MATTKPKTKKLSWASLLQALMALLPWLLETLNKQASLDNPEDVTVFFGFDPTTGKLRTSSVAAEARPFVRTVVTKPPQ